MQIAKTLYHLGDSALLHGQLVIFFFFLFWHSRFQQPKTLITATNHRRPIRRIEDPSDHRATHVSAFCPLFVAFCTWLANPPLCSANYLGTAIWLSLG